MDGIKLRLKNGETAEQCWDRICREAAEHASQWILISIPRPNPKNKREILKLVEAKLEAMIEEQSKEKIKE